MRQFGRMFGRKLLTAVTVLAAVSALSAMTALTAFAGEWIQDGSRRWFQNSDGSYPKSGMYTIGEDRYIFDSYGYVVENQWVELADDNWYYCLPGGEVARNMWISGTYYVGSNGAMLKDTMTPDGYYVDGEGKYVAGAEEEYQGGGDYWFIDGDYDNRDQTGYWDTHRVDCHINMVNSGAVCHMDFGLYDITGTGYSLYDKQNPNGDSLYCWTDDGYHWNCTSTIRDESFTMEYNGTDTIVLNWRQTTWGGGKLVFKRQSGGGAG